MPPELIYQVTVAIAAKSEGEWTEWMLSRHIPDVMASGCFDAFRFMKQLSPGDSAKSAAPRTSYIIEYDCASREKLAAYQTDHAPRLQQEHAARYAGLFEAQRKILFL